MAVKLWLRAGAFVALTTHLVNLRFLHLNARFPGSSHDAFVLSNSGLPTRMETLPEGGWLLADSGYPLKNWLLTPFATPRNDSELKFNTAHGRTRVVVERAFWVLKSRFRYYT